MTTPLKLARERRQLSQYAVAAAVGVTRVHITRIEAGTIGASPALAKKLSDFFDGTLTRLEILYPEEHLKPEPRSPGSQRPRQEQAA
jgi:transcriptional regulator with XRE-family HTH domain